MGLRALAAFAFATTASCALVLTSEYAAPPPEARDAATLDDVDAASTSDAGVDSSGSPADAFSGACLAAYCDPFDNESDLDGWVRSLSMGMTAQAFGIDPTAMQRGVASLHVQYPATDAAGNFAYLARQDSILKAHVYLRVFVRVTSNAGNFLLVSDRYHQTAVELGLGGDGQVYLSSYSNAVPQLVQTSPGAVPTGFHPSNDWFCVRLELDTRAGGAITAHLGSSSSASVTITKLSTALDFVSLGTNIAAGPAGGVWFDELAYGPQEIGCGD